MFGTVTPFLWNASHILTSLPSFSYLIAFALITQCFWALNSMLSESKLNAFRV